MALPDISHDYSTPVGVQSIVINPSVCASACLCVCPCVCVCLSTSNVWNRWTDRHEILCADPMWPWLGPPPAALRYVMCFRLYGRRHVWPQ